MASLTLAPSPTPPAPYARVRWVGKGPVSPAQSWTPAQDLPAIGSPWPGHTTPQCLFPAPPLPHLLGNTGTEKSAEHPGTPGQVWPPKGGSGVELFLSLFVWGFFPGLWFVGS